MKKFLAILLALMLVFSLAACNNDGEGGGGEGGTELAGTYKITVWCPDAAVDLTKTQIEDFNNSNDMGIKFEATVEPVSEADAANNVINDVNASGDLYFFAQDQLSRLIEAGAVSKLGAGAAKTVTENNDAGTVKGATAGDSLYAYPLTSDNGYFMYYDKSVIPDADVDSLEKLIEDCEKAGKFFAFELENGWYNAGFFFGTGCHSEWTYNDDGTIKNFDDDFNSDNGLIAAKGIYKLVSSTCYVNGSTADQFSSNAAIVVTGTWNYEDIKTALGDNMGVTDLPSYTVDGKEYHIGSFNGCKLLGAKPQSDAKKGAAVNQLALYLTGEKCQQERFNAFSWGPSNLKVQASPEVQANPALAALAKQNAYSVPQGNIPQPWWDICKNITTEVKASDGSDDALKAAIAKYEADNKSSIGDFNQGVLDEAGKSDEEKNAWSVIGAIGGSNWDKDFPMTQDGDIWTSNDSFELEAGAELKCRQGGAWDVSVGAGDGNFVVETAGTYKVQLDTSTNTITLIPA